MNQVPVAMFGGSGNYASALFIAAAKAKALDKVESELLDLVAATEKSPTFSQFMKDLAVPADTRVKAVTEICDQAKFSEVTKNFLILLADNGRLRHVDTITKRFSDLTMAHRGEIKAIVTTVIVSCLPFTILKHKHILKVKVKNIKSTYFIKNRLENDCFILF
ncbi:putative ATPase, OSCP/delta subunit, F1F0 ATP synthase OSCP/delta subunit domain superfamily [Helianthus annuus]|nr:putative ATPase, OSCP/delta subunit, F1F0 ATP synthase OSCP/delta subunit domain superfamily [Helianthus annuus]